jgi:pyruvate dehydrogenase phosphatase
MAFQKYTQWSYRGAVLRLNICFTHPHSSTTPCEDFIVSTLNKGDIPWTFFGVFDGHNGNLTSETLSNLLIPVVASALGELYSEHNHFSIGNVPRIPPPEAIENSIKRAFQEVDAHICNDSVEAALSVDSKPISVAMLAPAYSGSYALMGFYDHEIRQFRIALTGDSRAVLGRRSKDASGRERFTVHVISSEQRGKSNAEEMGINAVSSGDMIVENGRTLGREIFRTFGDAKFKWNFETQEALRTGHLGGSIPPNVNDLPRLTAEPEITTTDVEPGDFVIMASDGLWKSLTDEEVVGLVGMWMNQQHKGRESGVTRDELPVEIKDDKTVMYRHWVAKKRFLNVDENVAVHLARNALGGADRVLLSALMVMPPPRVTKFRYVPFLHVVLVIDCFQRDDVSAIVVFFDDNDEQGNGGVIPKP